MFCPKCKQPITLDLNFCPHCGYELKEQPISLLKQIGLVLFALILPPLGIVPGIKYLQKQSAVAKRLGIVLLVATVISTLATVWTVNNVLNNASKNINSQLNQFQLNQ